MRYVTYNVLVPDETVQLSPFGIWRDPGGMCEGPKSAIRTLQIIELMASCDQPLRAIDVGRALDLSPSSCNHLLKSMMDWGYLIFDAASKRYFPSPRMARLGSKVDHSYFGPLVLDGLMQAVRRRLDVSVTISACQGTFMQVVDHLLIPGREITSDEHASVAGIGLQVPLIGSGVGAAWLASQTEETVDAALRLCRRELSWQGCDEVSFRRRLGEIRRQGYSFGGMSPAGEVRSLSLPLPPGANGIVLVLCLNTYGDEMDARKDEIAHVAQDLVQLHLGSARRPRA